MPVNKIYSKFQVKVQDLKGELTWAHLGYVSIQLWQRFEKHKNKKGWDNNKWVDKWAYEEFEIEGVHKPENFELLKRSIQTKFKRIYPELYMEPAANGIDRQGWGRVWITRHMMRELNYNWPGRYEM